MSKPYLIRLPTDSDKPFVISSYLKSQRFVNSNKDMRDSIYYNTFKQKAEYIANNTKLLIACNPEDNWHVFGWLSFSPNPFTLHYIYVKHPYRRAGIATDLYRTVNPLQLQLQTTHTCRIFEQLKDKFHLEFNPIFKPKEPNDN